MRYTQILWTGIWNKWLAGKNTPKSEPRSRYWLREPFWKWIRAYWTLLGPTCYLRHSCSSIVSQHRNIVPLLDNGSKSPHWPRPSSCSWTARAFCGTPSLLEPPQLEIDIFDGSTRYQPNHVQLWRLMVDHQGEHLGKFLHKECWTTKPPISERNWQSGFCKEGTRHKTIAGIGCTGYFLAWKSRCLQKNTASFRFDILSQVGLHLHRNPKALCALNPDLHMSLLKQWRCPNIGEWLTPECPIHNGYRDKPWCGEAIELVAVQPDIQKETFRRAQELKQIPSPHFGQVAKSDHLFGFGKPMKYYGVPKEAVFALTYIPYIYIFNI